MRETDLMPATFCTGGAFVGALRWAFLTILLRLMEAMAVAECFAVGALGFGGGGAAGRGFEGAGTAGSEDHVRAVMRFSLESFPTSKEPLELGSSRAAV